MVNPFETIIELLNELKGMLVSADDITPQQAIEIIDRHELCKRLSITEPTAIRWEKKGKIPSMRIGSSVRYNWQAVIKALERSKR